MLKRHNHLRHASREVGSVVTRYAEDEDYLVIPSERRPIMLNQEVAKLFHKHANEIELFSGGKVEPESNRQHKNK